MDGQTMLLCRLDEVPDGQARGFDRGGHRRDRIFMVRRGETVVAYRDACPHFGDTPMAWRTDAYLNGDGTYIACHSHGALFDIATGECIQGPCLGQSLRRVEVMVTEEGEVLLAQSDPVRDDLEGKNR